MTMTTATTTRASCKSSNSHSGQHHHQYEKKKDKEPSSSWRRQPLRLLSPLVIVIAKILIIINFVYVLANLVGRSVKMLTMMDETSQLASASVDSAHMWEVDSLSPVQNSSSSASSSTTTIALFEGQPFKDALCVGCREEIVSSQIGITTCGKLIYQQLQVQHSKNLTNATHAVLLNVDSDPNAAAALCNQCQPDACTETEKVYWRPDDAGPRVLQATTLYLPSIPVIHRVPDPNIMNLTMYFSNKSHVHPVKSYFFEYNPSLVQIPSSQIPRHILTEREANETVYLASFRVTNLQQCVKGDNQIAMLGGDWRTRPKFVNYLGLALLRSDLSIVADVVLNNKGRTTSALRGMQDYRLFRLGEQLYVTSKNRIVPIWLKPPTNNSQVLLVKNLFPSKINVYTRSFVSCIEVKGKNINYFVDEQRNETIAEIFPMRTKQVVNLTSPCTARRPTDKARTIHSNESLPIKSFGSLEQIHFFNHGAFDTLSGERGSACCVRIRDPTITTQSQYSHRDRSNNHKQHQLLLGISHSKTKFLSKETRHNLPGNVSSNHFFSAFYAMEPFEPFTVRARSGRFCLGFPTVNETVGFGDDGGGRRRNPYSRNNMGKLRLGGDHFDCPHIHFVSGMVEKANDASKVIIAYGVQDCAPRFIEVDKENILQMLFPHIMLTSSSSSSSR